jgi:hypothetical protein
MEEQMKNFAMGLAVAMAGVLILAPGCGDDDATAGSGGSGGSGGGSSGSSSEGGATSGGSTSGGGETGDAGAGNTSSGGAPEGGATAGGASAGGAGGAGFMNPEGCPEAAPDTNDDCFVTLDLQESCEYPGSRCVCNGYTGSGGAGGAMAGNWLCQGDAGDCPETAPATEDECTDNGLNCPYPGDVNCFCAADAWDCDDPGAGDAGGAGNTPGECPTEQPADEAVCVGGIYGCSYEETSTVCNCPGAGPNADQWNCQEF